MKKYSFLLLEVLIALFITTLAALPLLLPTLILVQQEHLFTESIGERSTCNKFFATLIEQLYKNELPWEKIFSKEKFPFVEGNIKGCYSFSIEKQKPSFEEESLTHLFLVRVYIEIETKKALFAHSANKQIFSRLLFMVHHI